MVFNIDWGFIGQLEGAGLTTGYVPTDRDGSVIGQSGVTIATGFDIGQHSAAEIAALFGEDTAITRLLAPYAGLTRAAAVSALRNAPLEVTRAQADAIDRAVKESKASQLAGRYDRAVAAANDRALLRFRALPRRAQTVIASVLFQYGNLATRTPTFWGRVVAQDWPGSVAELRAFGDRYGRRRRLEADYLEPLIEARN